MKKRKLKSSITDIALMAVSVLFMFGMIFVFKACAPKEDGTMMSCHWAHNTILGLSVVITVISGFHFLAAKQSMKQAFSLSLLPISILTFLIPGKMIDLCMMQNMHCHSVMTPAVSAFSILIFVTAAVDLFMQNKRGVR